MTGPSDRIVRSANIAAPRERVWRALTDHQEFGAWFRVRLDGPFVPGAATRGRITHSGYEHLTMEVVTQCLEPPGLFSFTWHPYAVDPAVDYSAEPPTLVEFLLEPVPGGTRVTVTESGFDRLPPHRRDEAFRMNRGGWEAQVVNLKAHAQNPR
jgi:uncharacterized protein YndB with AHSA1/START domain